MKKEISNFLIKVVIIMCCALILILTYNGIKQHQINNCIEKDNKKFYKLNHSDCNKKYYFYDFCKSIRSSCISRYK